MRHQTDDGTQYSKQWRETLWTIEQRQHRNCSPLNKRAASRAKFSSKIWSIRDVSQQHFGIRTLLPFRAEHLYVQNPHRIKGTMGAATVRLGMKFRADWEARPNVQVFMQDVELEAPQTESRNSFLVKYQHQSSQERSLCRPAPCWCVCFGYNLLVDR